MTRNADEKCFACGKVINVSPYPEADTRDGQIVYVGPDCAKRVASAGEAGYQPPRGGPKLYPMNNSMESLMENSATSGVSRGNAKYGTRKNYSTEDMKDELLEQIRMRCGSGPIGQDKAKQAAWSIVQDAKGDLGKYIRDSIGNEFDLQHYIENL